MALDTFIVFAASYDTLDAAEADYHAVHDFYLRSGLLEAYDAAVVTKDETGQVRIVVKHEQPKRQSAWRGLVIGVAGSAIDEGHSGLVVVTVSDLGDLAEVIKRASSLTRQPPDHSLEEAVAESEAAVREAEREAEAAERAAEQYSALGSRPPPRGDLASQLDDLVRLHDKGALNRSEFEAAKSRLLSG